MCGSCECWVNCRKHVRSAEWELDRERDGRKAERERDEGPDQVGVCGLGTGTWIFSPKTRKSH